MANVALKIDSNINARLEDLISQGTVLSKPNMTNGRSSVLTRTSNSQFNQICGWVASTENLLRMLFKGDVFNSYLSQISTYRISIQASPTISHVYAGSIHQVLIALKIDLQHGLVGDLEGKIQAITFDDFLDHAEEYCKQKRHMESGVIAGVVFEDTIKKLCAKYQIPVNSDKLENHINALTAAQIITGTKAKRCKSAAGVRTQATHAKWDQFDLQDVKETISISRELIADHMEK